MAGLEEIKSKIEEFCKGKFDIFYCKKTPESEESKVAIWQGSWEDFLKFGERRGVKIVYLYTIRIEEDDVEHIEHKGEIGYIEIGYFIGDVYHIFVESSEWFNSSEEDIEESNEEEAIERNKEGIKELKEKTIDDLSQEMITYCKEQFPELFTDADISSIHKMQEFFWLEKGIREQDIYSLDSKLRLKIEKVNEGVRKRIEEGNENMEKIKEMPIDKLSQEMIEYFKSQFPEVFENVMKGEIMKIDKLQESFWTDMGIRHTYNLDSKLKFKIEKVNERVKKEISEEKKKKEEEMLPKLVEECTDWARKMGLNKLNKTNIRAFLSDREIVLTALNLESLLVQVNNLLKTEKKK
jgi:hypothetical protein